MCSDFFEISANINAIIVYKAKKINSLCSSKTIFGMNTFIFKHSVHSCFLVLSLSDLQELFSGLLEALL